MVDFTIHAGEHPKVDKDQKYLFLGLNVLNSGVRVEKSTFADIPVGITTNKKIMTDVMLLLAVVLYVKVMLHFLTKRKM